MVDNVLIVDREDYPSDIESLLKEIEDKRKSGREEKLASLSKFVAKLRDQAVSARRNSGFERQWREDEEFNIGVDDLNRDEDQHNYHKPGNGSDILREKVKASSTECTAFLNMTAPFVAAAAARCADILLPSNDWNFSIKATPVPEFAGYENDERPIILGADGSPVKTLGDTIKERNEEAAKRVRKAESHIRDWLVQSNYRKECMKVIEDAALVGVGILKGPYSKKQTKQVYVDGELIVEESMEPGTCRVDYWNFFPDMNCGEDINDGDYVFERDFLYARSLLELKGSGYIDSAIDKVIAEGPGKRNINENQANKNTADDDRFEIWYCYKYISSDELRLIDSDYDKACSCNLDNDGNEVNDMKPFLASIMLVNDTIIYANKWPINDNGFPFDVFIWQRVKNQPFGIGVARQGRTPQKTILAAFRTLMNNQGLAAKPMMAFLQEALEPLDKTWQIYGGKAWKIKAGKGVTDIKQAISAIVIPSLQADLSALIQFGNKAMEDSTGITFLMQGQQGSAPDTVGGQQLMLQNSSTLLRRITRNYDEVTKAHITRYYMWLLLFGPDDEKGDYMIEATGSSSLLEREIQSAQLPQLMQLSQNPVFEMSPKKTADELIRAWRFDPSKFEIDEDEKQNMAQRPQPSDPRIQVAQMQIQKDLQIAEQNKQLKVMQLQKDQDRDAVFAQGVTERNQMMHQATIAELQLRERLAMLDYANKKDITLDKVKAELAGKAMEISSVKELAAMEAPASKLPKPPVEPVGLAESGHSFTQ